LSRGNPFKIGRNGAVTRRSNALSDGPRGHGPTILGAVSSRLGPERVSVNAAEVISDAHMEDLDLGVGEPEPV
jgi:hypothetical protein